MALLAREYVFREKVSPQTKRLLKLEEDEIKLSYRIFRMPIQRQHQS